MRYTYTPYLECRHCAALIGWPRWARVEPLRYIPLCWSCYRDLDRDFTADYCIRQAVSIVRRAGIEAWL